MSCRVQNGKAILPNGKESELFKSLVRATGNIDEATNLYEQVHSKNFVDWYGNWEKDYTPNLFSDTLLTDDIFNVFQNWEDGDRARRNNNPGALAIKTEGTSQLIQDLWHKFHLFPVTVLDQALLMYHP